jgi:hypothetical protein
VIGDKAHKRSAQESKNTVFLLSDLHNKFMNLKEEQSKFIRDELWKLTLYGAFQRNTIYRRKDKANPKNDVTDKEKNEFREELRIFVDQLVVKSYKTKCEEKEHIENIIALTKWSKKFAHILHNPSINIGASQKILHSPSINIGTSQKILNLFLKYLWCSGLLENQPPHCPFDSIIIKKIKSRDLKPWTSIDDISAYRKLVGLAKDVIGDGSIAEWELAAYNESNV